MKLYLFSVIVGFFIGSIHGFQDSKSERELKVLVLIISSDDLPVYQELQKIWKSYMHLDPEHVEVYFIRGNPHLSAPAEVDNDIIWIKTEENLIPGILNKTILSLDYMLDRLQEFDYILRTNLSSFYVFPKLLNFLKNAPKSNFYCGSDIGDPNIGSGCGFIMSPDLVSLLVAHKNHFINNTLSYDDVVIGKFFQNRRIRLIPHKRASFYSIDDWENQKNHITDDIFHFRVKTAPHLRLTDDVFIQMQLLNKYYS